MRCTRCDRPTIPQATGRTPEGVLVFGWCVACLDEAGCRDVTIAARNRRGSTRLRLLGRSPTFLLKDRIRRRARSRALARVEPSPSPRPGSPEFRRQIVVAFSGALGLWGLVLLTSGLTLLRQRAGRPVSPYGNGTPPLLIGGGSATAMVALFLWAFAAGGASRYPSQFHRALCGLGLALTALLLGFAVMDPTRRTGTIPLGLVLFAAVIAYSALIRSRAAQPRPVWPEGPEVTGS